MIAEKTNKWLTLLANVGVVIGLALLIFEIRQNGELVRAQIHQARSDEWVSARQDLADSEYILPAWEKFVDAGAPGDPSALTTLGPIEAARVYRYMQSRAGDYDNLYFQYRQGYLDEEFYKSRIEPSMNRFARVWLEAGIIDSMTTSFRAEIERLATEPD